MHDGIEAAATTVLADFMTTHPEARIEVVVDTGQAQIDAMEAGKRARPVWQREIGQPNRAPIILAD
jgi:hypothetical protein